MRASLRGWIILIMTIAISVAAAREFRAMHAPEPIVAGPGVVKRALLSDYAPALKETAADTPVYFLGGAVPGPTLLIFGGTHPQEIAGMLTAVVVTENVELARGRIIVIPQMNRSGFTYTEPLEAFPHTYAIGSRWFRVGMRLTNPIHQWPDPDLYLHHPSGEPLIGTEARNLNRAFPGRAEGRYTERLAHAVLNLVRQEQADIVLDLHEAYPEYPIINMLVVHERAAELGALTQLALQSRHIAMNLMPSPKRLHGLSHRELGDHTNALALLAETANPAMGRFRGRTDEALVVHGRDSNYVEAARLRRLFVPFDEAGHPLSDRVARHLATIEEIIAAYNEANALDSKRTFEVRGLPRYDEVRKGGLEPYLRPVAQRP